MKAPKSLPAAVLPSIWPLCFGNEAEDRGNLGSNPCPRAPSFCEVFGVDPQRLAASHSSCLNGWQKSQPLERQIAYAYFGMTARLKLKCRSLCNCSTLFLGAPYYDHSSFTELLFQLFRLLFNYSGSPPPPQHYGSSSG